MLKHLWRCGSLQRDSAPKPDINEWEEIENLCARSETCESTCYQHHTNGADGQGNPIAWSWKMLQSSLKRLADKSLDFSETCPRLTVHAPKCPTQATYEQAYAAGPPWLSAKGSETPKSLPWHLWFHNTKTLQWASRVWSILPWHLGEAVFEIAILHHSHPCVPNSMRSPVCEILMSWWFIDNFEARTGGFQNCGRPLIRITSLRDSPKTQGWHSVEVHVSWNE